MSGTQFSLVAGIAAFVVVLGLGTAAVNRAVRKKLRFSLFLYGLFLVISLLLLAVDAKSQLRPDLQSIANLVFALASINAIVAVAINPLRVDRVPENFPNIVQDALTIAAFLLVSAVFMEAKWLTLSAVGGFVIGFALQDTLGNMFAGLAIQVEKPFSVGDWISAGGHEGQVTQITWRATKLTTKAGNCVVVPNNFIAKDVITNFSEPAAPIRLFVEVGITYDAPPNEVKRVLLDALQGIDLLLKTPAPEVVVADFGSSSIVYRVKFSIGDSAVDDRARDRVRTAIYYALKRRDLEIPYPTHVTYQHETHVTSRDERLREIEPVIGSADLFASLADDDRAALAASSAERLYGSGEAIVRQGQAGDSMFVVCRGEVRVTIDPGGHEVARIAVGGYFGEMSLLTGEPRSATVSAVTDCVVLEITADEFRRVAAMHPAIVDQVSLAVAARRAGLERTRDAATATPQAPETPHSFLERVQQFLRLPGARS